MGEELESVELLLDDELEELEEELDELEDEELVVLGTV